MANVQIPNLPAAISLNGTEQLEAVQAGATCRITTAQIANFVAEASTPFPVNIGGTGAATFTAGYLKADGTNPFTTVATIPNTDITGLGTMSTQDANSVSITGGSISNVTITTSTPLAISSGGTGETTASAAANALDGYLGITSAGGTTTLTNTSARTIVVTGTSAQTIQLPDVTTLALGWSFIISNTTNNIVTVQSSGGNSFTNTLTAGLSARLVCVAITGTTTASWAFTFIGSTGRTGTGSLVYNGTPTITTPLIAQISGGSAVSSTLTLQSTSGAGTSDAIIFNTGSQLERMRITTAGNVGIGVNNPSAPLQIFGTTQNRLWLSSAAINSRQLFVRSNGTFASPTIVASGDAIGSVNFFGYDGASNIELASMAATVDGTPGTNDMPGRLVFSTTADGALSPTERLRISNAGVTTITGTGIINANSSTDALRITQTGAGNAILVEDSANPDATPFLVDANGIVISGSLTSISGTAGIARFQSNNSLSGFSAHYAGVDASPAINTFLKSRGGAIVASGDQIGSLRFEGFDGTNYLRAAQIAAFVDATPGTNDMPGRLTFSTTADGASDVTERMRIDSAGVVSITGSLTLTTDLTVPNGGTGVSTFTTDGVLYGAGAGAILATAQGGANTILTANAGAPSFSASPTIGTSVTVPQMFGGTGAGSTITIHSTSGAGTTDAVIIDTASQVERVRVDSSGVLTYFQPAQTSLAAAATLDAAQVRTRIIQYTGAAATVTLPTGTTLDTVITSGMTVNSAFELTFINTSANLLTIGANGNTTVGLLTVAANTSGTFRFRKTAANTFTVYRVS